MSLSSFQGKTLQTRCRVGHEKSEEKWKAERGKRNEEEEKVVVVVVEDDHERNKVERIHKRGEGEGGGKTEHAKEQKKKKKGEEKRSHKNRSGGFKGTHD